MRKSVLTGVFACTLILSINSSKAGATASEILESNPGDSAITLLATAVPDSDLEFNEDTILPQELEQPQVEEPAIPEGPTVHEVAEGESLSEVAKQYDVQWKRLYDKNEDIKDPNVIDVGLKIEIPEQDEEVTVRDLPVPPPAPAPVVRTAVSAPRSSAVAVVRTQARGSSAGNVYTAGNCTWYSKSRRPDMPNNLGNARTWAIRASNQGMATGYTPRAGAIAQKGNHVVYIESVNADGTMTLSEMNYRGLYQITTRTVSPAGWRFIY